MSGHDKSFGSCAQSLSDGSNCDCHHPFIFQPLVFFKLLVFLLPDVAVIWDGYIEHHHFLLEFVNQHSVQVVIWRSCRIFALSFSATFGGISSLDFGILLGTDVLVRVSSSILCFTALLLCAGSHQRYLCTALTWRSCLVQCNRLQPLYLLCSEPVLVLQ